MGVVLAYPSTKGFGATSQVRAIDAQIDALLLKRTRVVGNVEKWGRETPDQMTARLRRFYTRLGLRDVRYELTGDRRKAPIQDPRLAALTFIRQRWIDSHEGFEGVELRVEDVAEHIGRSLRQTRRIIGELERRGLVVRLEQQGCPTRYAVTLPETETYRETMLTTFDAYLADLQRRANAEAKLPYLEPATTPGLEYLRDPNYQPPKHPLQLQRGCEKLAA